MPPSFPKAVALVIMSTERLRQLEKEINVLGDRNTILMEENMTLKLRNEQILTICSEMIERIRRAAVQSKVDDSVLDAIQEAKRQLDWL